MGEVVLKVENLTKVYRLGEIGTGTISHDLNRWWARIRGKEDPFSKVGVINDRTQKASKGEYVKVLDNINFEVQRGEVLGIIGKNGAGKSTLLKVISQITSPTEGTIMAKGRIASLLEVGTGMHPEMTGKENVYLNGTILGMTKKEIDNKFDEIMDFAGCAKYADTPVKRYSSGMKVRLGFAVAAFLEPEILIVDEVLAVGDAEFQKKAIGKMKDVTAKGDRTVLFVSHNMAAVKSLCKSALLLRNGELLKIGDVNDVIEDYLQGSFSNDIMEYKKIDFNIERVIEIKESRLRIREAKGELYISYVVRKKVGAVIGINVRNSREISILRIKDNDANPDLFNKEPGNYSFSFLLPLDYLAPDQYFITVSIADMKSERYEYLEDLLCFTIDIPLNGFEDTIQRRAILNPDIKYVGKTWRDENIT